MFKFKFWLCGLGGGGGGKGEDAVDGGSDAGDFSTEYAKSGKSKCKGCEDFIGKVWHSLLYSVNCSYVIICFVHRWTKLQKFNSKYMYPESPLTSSFK